MISLTLLGLQYAAMTTPTYEGEDSLEEIGDILEEEQPDPIDPKQNAQFNEETEETAKK